MSEYAKEQPKDGDKVLTCGHVDADLHFWKVQDGSGIIAKGPEGDVKIDWLMACSFCFHKAEGDLKRIAWVHYDTWVGDEPIIKLKS